MTRLNYYSLEQLLQIIGEPYKSIFQDLVSEFEFQMYNAPGSTHNHQAWRGGYMDHVLEVMNIAVQLYAFLSLTGRKFDGDEQFELKDALIVLFLHDIEKAWRVELTASGEPLIDPENDRYEIAEAMRSKDARELFKLQLIQDREVMLSQAQMHALHFVEGMRDADYSPGDRVMSPLATFCHICDMWSARIFYDFPHAYGDTWAIFGRTHKP